MLLDLMHGLREPSHGYVLVDDVDIRSLQPAALRRHVTLVRGFEIVVGSIGENVHLDRDGVTGRNIREALAEVGLLEEIMALPEGLNTELLPSGSPLSESQVHRLVMARALAKPSRVLLIDGVCDSISDDLLPRVMRALRQLKGKTTVVLVTGRNDIADFCDRRIVAPPDGDWSKQVKPNRPDETAYPSRMQSIK